MATPAQICRLASPWIQDSPYMFRITRDEREIGSRWLIGFGAPLFPIAERAERNVLANGELFLR